MAEGMKSWAAEVVADSTNKFFGNGIRLKTKEEAENYARDLMSRWMLVREWRVVESADEVNYEFGSGGLKAVGKAA